MKTIRFLLFFLTLVSSIFAQEQILRTDLLKIYGEQLDESPIGLENDSTGYYSIIVSKSNNIFGIDTIPNDSIERSYLVKYNFNGDIIRFKQIECKDSIIITALTKKNNKLYFSSIEKKLNFNIATIYKYDTDFNFLTSDTLFIIPTLYDNFNGIYISKIKIDNNDDLIISGSSYDTILVQGDTLGNTPTSYSDYYYGFIIKYDENNILKWTYELSDNIINFDIDENNNIYFNMFPSSNLVLNHDTTHISFIQAWRGYISYAKISPNGQTLWHKEIGRKYGTNYDVATLATSKIVYNKNFGLLISGEHNGLLDFADSSFHEIILPGLFFFASIDTLNGNLSNNYYYNDVNNIRIHLHDILINNDKLVFIGSFATSYIERSFSFGNTTLTSINDSAGWNNNILIFEFDTNYNPITCYSINTDKSSFNFITKSCKIINNNITIISKFEDECHTYDSLYLSSNGDFDVFLITIKDDVRQGIENIKLDNSLRIYPNPTTTGVLYITSIQSINKIILFDINGKKIKEVLNVNDKDYILNLNKDYKEGIYLIKIITKSKVYTKKIIIK